MYRRAKTLITRKLAGRMSKVVWGVMVVGVGV